MTGDRTKYPIAWATIRTKELYQKHPRATEFSLYILKISLHQLSILLANGRREFQVIRETIKAMDKWAQLGHADIYGVHYLTAVNWFFDSLEKRLGGNGPKTFLAYLTARRKELITEEPVIKGAGGGEIADPSQPYDSPRQLEFDIGDTAAS